MSAYGSISLDTSTLRLYNLIYLTCIQYSIIISQYSFDYMIHMKQNLLRNTDNLKCFNMIDYDMLND